MVRPHPENLDQEIRQRLTEIIKGTNAVTVEAELGIHHADGKTWFRDAPLPRYFHRCRPWTTSPKVERCPCGRLRFVGDYVWIRRNSERKGRAR